MVYWGVLVVHSVCANPLLGLVVHMVSEQSCVYACAQCCVVWGGVARAYVVRMLCGCGVHDPVSVFGTQTIRYSATYGVFGCNHESV